MLKKLEKKLKELKKVAIAFSGGIDSSFLLFYANKVLGRENVLAIIANGSMLSNNDYQEAINFLKNNNFEFKEIEFNPLENVFLLFKKCFLLFKKFVENKKML